MAPYNWIFTKDLLVTRQMKQNFASLHSLLPVHIGTIVQELFWLLFLCTRKCLDVHWFPEDNFSIVNAMAITNIIIVVFYLLFNV